MPYTVRFDPNSTSQQAQVIPNATLNNDGVMTRVMAAQLAALEAQSGAISKIVTNAGVIPCNTLTMISDPNIADQVIIGGQLFEYVGALGPATNVVQIQQGLGAALAKAALLDAINGVANPNVVQCTPTFDLPLVADSPVGYLVRVSLSTVRGGAPVAGTPPSITFSAVLPFAFEIWEVANIDATGGNPSGPLQMSRGKILITADMVTNGGVNISFPFTVFSQSCTVLDSLGMLKYVSEQFAVFFGNLLGISVNAGATPLIAGDTVLFTVYGE